MTDKETKKLLTIAIPVYERTTYFLEAVNSILNQTVKCDIIVVDNASTHSFFKDKCSELNVKYYRNDSNIGMFGNWNRCVELSTSEYVMILGDDDVLEDNYVEQFLDAYKENNDLDIFYTNTAILYDSGVQNTKSFFKYGWRTGQEVLDEGAENGFVLPFLSFTIKRSLYKQYPFITSPHITGDTWWAYINTPKDAILFGSDKVSMYYRIHGDQDTAKAPFYPNLSALALLSFFKERVSDKYHKILNRRINNRLAELLIRFPHEMIDVFVVKSEENFITERITEELSRNFLFKLFMISPILRLFIKAKGIKSLLVKLLHFRIKKKFFI